MKDIAAFIWFNRGARIRIYADVTTFGEILKYLKMNETHKVEFYEDIRLLLEDIRITEKYCELERYTDIKGYYILILSRGKARACILCKETSEDGYHNIIIGELYSGIPEFVGNLMRDKIIAKGGYDYDLKG